MRLQFAAELAAEEERRERQKKQVDECHRKQIKEKKQEKEAQESRRKAEEDKDNARIIREQEEIRLRFEAEIAAERLARPPDAGSNSQKLRVEIDICLTYTTPLTFQNT